MSDAMPNPENRQSIPTHWIVLGFLVVAHTGLGAYFNGRLGNIKGHVDEFLTMGLLFSQPMLLAFWAAFAPQPFYQRSLWCFFLCTMVSFFEQLNALEHTQNLFKEIMMMSLATFFVATMVFLAVRWISRWQIRHTIVEAARSAYEPSQFGVKHLIILITITAVCCGLIRSLFIMNRNWELGQPIVEWVGRASVMLFLILPVIVIPWIVMACRPKVLWLLLVMISVETVCIVSGGCIIGLCFSNQALSDVFVREGRAMLMIQLGAALSVVVSSLVLRFCGFSLVRVPKVSPPQN
jgi:hypothetical protein